MSEKWILLNDAFYLEKEAFIPITDRGFLFGEGIFTTIRVHQGQCELWEAHLLRLKRQSQELQFDWKDLHFEQMNELIERNNARKGTWRLKIIVTVKEEGMIRKTGSVLVILDPYQEISIPSRLCLFPHPLESPLAHLKSLSYLDHLYVRNFAQQQGYVDAITCTREGFLLETGCSNLFWIDQGKCWVPDLQLPYLKGVFLQALLSHLSLPIQFVKARIDQLPASASVYTCNALTHVRSVLSIEERLFPRSSMGEECIRQAIDQVLKKEAMDISY